MNIVEKALNLWVKITGIDPNATKIRFNEWDIRSMNEDLKRSLLLDDTGATTLMLLEHFMQNYADEKAFTMTEILANFESLKQYMNLFHELKDLFMDEDLTNIKENMKKELRAAMERSGLATESNLGVLDDEFALAVLRRDALNSINTLTTHQFYQGEPGAKPIFLDEVYTCWNINSLIRLVSKSFESGICLCLVRDQKATSSYFAFAIKNGGTLSILTDKPSYSHPLQKYMSRRPGRDLEQRTMKNHFPYELLDLSIDGRGDLMVKNSTALAPYQTELVPLKKMAELNRYDVVWLIMMFSLIEEKFFKNNFKTPKLSYTGEMARTENLLDVSIANLPAVKDYKVLDVPRMTPESVNSENTKDDWAWKPTRINQWLEDRYGDGASEDVLNQIEANDGKYKKYLTTESTGIQLVDTQEDGKKPFWEQYDHLRKQNNNAFEIQALDPTSFGSEEEILSDVKWIGRYNKAKYIEKEAVAEYKERNQEIIQWFAKKVEENKENLIQYIFSGQCIESVGRHEEFASEPKYTNNMVDVKPERERGYYYLNFDHGDRKVDLSGQLFQRPGYHYSDIKPDTMTALFTPRSADGIRILTGCNSIEELPDVLQNWHLYRDYGGNSILQRLDPMDWAFENPWRTLKFRTMLYFSKSFYNQKAKELGIKDAKKFWIKDSDEK